ncbi:MAG: cupin domain-containing protein [Tissierellia bacterium]|nr:cupin domain-containing protein [Tissierellia bacterium]
MIGSKIKQARLNKKMTLKDLAEKTDFTAGYISQLERDIIEPSLSSLRKIATCLNVPLFAFLENTEIQTAVIHSDKRQKMQFSDSNIVYEFLTPLGSSQESSPKMVVLYVQIEPGTWSNDEWLTHSAEECIFVLRGTVDVLTRDKQYRLNDGDSLYIHENTPHKIFNPGTKKAITISAMTPAIFISNLHT